MKRSIRAAICRIDVIRDGETRSRGTGTLVAPGIVLTALHVVADRKTSPPTPHPGLLVLTFPDHKTEARIHGDDLNPNDDWVLLQCEAPPPVPPVPMGRLSQRGVDWETYGWPDANSRDGMTLTGTVENCEGELEAVTALQLFSKEAAAGAGAKVSGLSGAPVVVDDWLVGHLRFALMQEGRTEAGTIYACPAAAVAKRCPTVLTLGTVPYRQSTTTAIISEMREGRRWARWAILGVVLAAILVVSLLAWRRGRTTSGQAETAIGLQLLMDSASNAVEAGDNGLLSTLTANQAIPNYEKWFKRTFGDAAGAILATDYSEKLQTMLADAGAFFRDAADSGYTAVRVITVKNDTSIGMSDYQRVALGYMKRATTMYTVEMGPFHLESFVYVDGAFRLASDMRPLVCLDAGDAGQPPSSVEAMQACLTDFSDLVALRDRQGDFFSRNQRYATTMDELLGDSSADPEKDSHFSFTIAPDSQSYVATYTEVGDTEGTERRCVFFVGTDEAPIPGATVEGIPACTGF